ncbi:hypothetical protein DMP15_28700 [Pseudonocardia sp. UM4_GMWB1]|jgi:hypothetical protein
MPDVTTPYGPNGPQNPPPYRPGPAGQPQYGQPQQQWGPPQQQWAATPPPPPEPPKKKGGKLRWVVAVVGLLVLVGMINGGKDEPADTTAAAAPAAAAPAAAAPAQAEAVPAAEENADGYGKKTASFGEEVNAGGMIVTAQAPKELSQPYLGTQACATVTLRNEADSQKSFSPFDWKFRTKDGVEVTANIPFNADKALNTGQLTPGGKVSGQVCADTQTTGVTTVVYNPGFGIMHEITFQ